MRRFRVGKEETRTIEPDELDKKFKPGFYRQARTFLEMINTRQVPPLHGLKSRAVDGPGGTAHRGLYQERNCPDLNGDFIIALVTEPTSLPIDHAR